MLFQGEPLADAEVVVQAAGQEKAKTVKTNAKGVFELADQPQGRWALRARHIEKKNGTHDGKEYAGDPPLRDARREHAFFAACRASGKVIVHSPDASF